MLVWTYVYDQHRGVCQSSEWHLLYNGLAKYSHTDISDDSSSTSVNEALSYWPTSSRWHYNDIIMSTMASQTTSLTIVYFVFVHAQIKENIKAPRHWHLWEKFTGHRSPHKGPVTWKMFPFDNVIMELWVHADFITPFLSVAGFMGRAKRRYTWLICKTL